MRCMETALDDAEVGVTLASVLRDAGKHVFAVGDQLPFVVDDDEIGDALCELQSLKNQVDGLQRQLVAATEFSSVLAKTGQRTIEQYVAARTNARPVTVRRDRILAGWLRDFDLFAAETTVMSTEHLEYLRTKIDNPRTHRQLIADQQIFVNIATHAGWKEFTKVCDVWMVANDPDGEEPADQERRSRLSLRRGQGGRLLIDGQTDAVSGQLIENAVNDEAEKIRRDDLAAGVTRTEAQRRIAALVALVTRGAARNDGSFAKPLINVVISQKLIDWCLDQEAGLVDPIAPIPLDPNDPDGRCELIDGTPIHPHQVMALLAKADIRRLVLDAKSRVLDVSYSARSFPEWIRTARAVESRGSCEVPGCDSPHRWLQVDHVDPHSNGGKTRWSNSQNECRADNQAKAAQTGHKAWRDRTPPTRYRPSRE